MNTCTVQYEVCTVKDTFLFSSEEAEVVLLTSAPLVPSSDKTVEQEAELCDMNLDNDSHDKKVFYLMLQPPRLFLNKSSRVMDVDRGIPISAGFCANGAWS